MAKQWLVDIPLELRIMIYEQYFRSLRIRLHWLPGDGGVSRCDANCRDRMLPQLLRVARRVKTEAYPIFFTHTMFKISECCCWWDSFQKYRATPITFNRVQNISFALHEADFLRRFVLPGRYFKSICLKERRELILTRFGDTNPERKFIKSYSPCTTHFEYEISYKMAKDNFFNARIIVKNNSMVTLSYNLDNSLTKVFEFEKNHLSKLRSMYEELGFEVHLGSYEKAKLGVLNNVEDQTLRNSSPIPQLIESTVGCIVC